jgi:hypothetical protein
MMQVMRIRFYSKGKFYLIECPGGTRVVRAVRSVPAQADSHDRLIVPLDGRELAIPADPPKLLPLPAEGGHCGLALVGEPVPDVSLVGKACPTCDEDDVSWLSVEDGSNVAHSDNCGREFGLELRR